MNNLIIQKELQRGTFGTVYLAKLNNDKVAVKKIKKSMLKKYKIDPLIELEILLMLKNKFIVKFIYFFEDQKYIYHVLEYVDRDLYSIIQKEKINEYEALTYVKKISKGLIYLHLMKIAHLDIKPENILVNIDNEIKICDFGQSAIFKNGEKFIKHTGTLYYVAPEIAFNKLYDYKVDIWALGIIYYELIRKYPPFYSLKRDETLFLIKKCEIIFTNNFSRKTQIYILKLLNPNPNLRINPVDILKFNL